MKSFLDGKFGVTWGGGVENRTEESPGSRDGVDLIEHSATSSVKETHQQTDINGRGADDCC
ncbi:MAG: hypothetical protein CMJ46_08645 [Planctomyces sp.]|nr:hypothetical protein [Planctomyces sp.]